MGGQTKNSTPAFVPSKSSLSGYGGEAGAGNTGPGAARGSAPSNEGFKSGYGNGSISFDKQGNTLQNGKIIAFAGQQAKENFLTSQGLGNNNQITSEAKFAKADFSSVASYNIPGNQLNEPWKNQDQLMLESYLSQGRPSDKAKSDSVSSLVTFSKSGKTYPQSSFAPNQIYRGSAKEDLAKQREADKAAKIYPSTSNSDYLTGGKPQGSSVSWVAPQGNQYKNMGQGINNSLVRNSPQEAKAKTNEANRAASIFYPQQKEYGNNPVFTVGGPKYPVKENQVISSKEQSRSYGSAWVNAQLGTTQNYRGNTKQEQASLTAKGKEKPSTSTVFQGTPINDENSNISFSNGLISLSNKQITEKNNQTEFGNGLISLSNQQIRAANLKSEADLKSYLNQAQKEDATINFYTGNQKTGYKEVGQTSGQRSLYDFLKYQKEYKDLSYGKSYPKREKELSQAVGKNPDFYLSLSPAYWKELSDKGYYTEKNAPKIQSNLQTHNTAQNLGLLQGSLYSEIHGGEYPSASGPIILGPAEHEISSLTRVPYSGSKEYNQFTGFFGLAPTGPKLATSKVPSTSWVNVAQFAPGLPVIDRLAGPASEVWVNLLSKGGMKIGEVKTQFGNKVKSNIATRASEAAINYEPVRPTNLKELEPVGLQVSKQTMGKRPQTELERQLSLAPRVKENPHYQPTYSTRTPWQNKQPSFDINIKTETPIFKEPREITSSLLSPIEAASRERYPLMKNSLVSGPPKTSIEPQLYGKYQGTPPVNARNTGFNGLSPISREYFGVNFEGIYPKSYLPPSSGFTNKPTNPIVNLPERGDYQDFRFSQYMASANTKGKFGFSISQPKSEEPLPEVINPLGRRGKTAVKQSPTTDLILSRSKVVEETTPRYQHEVFSSGGNKLSKFFGETKSVGALSKSITKKNQRPEVNLEARKDYQDWRFSQWQKKNPEPIPLGDIRFDKDVARLPKGNKKAAVFTVNFKEKDLKAGFRRTSKPLFEQKPKEETKKNIEFKNTGSKQETVLLQKPLTRRRTLTSQEQQYEYNYEFKPVPSTKAKTGLVYGSVLSSRQNLSFHQGSLLAGLNKTLTQTKTKSSSRQTPKQFNKVFFTQQTKQGTTSKQVPKLFQTPKQGTTPKQAQKQTPKIPQSQRPKQTVGAKFSFAPKQEQLLVRPKTPRKLPTPLKFGSFPRDRTGKSKSGPTALVNLNVNNIFSSNLNINVTKSRRFEF